jgi:hypothetical protein
MKIPIAKAKKRQADEDADKEAIEAFEKSTPVIKMKPDEKPRNEVPTVEIVNIMADEIQELYMLSGTRLDEMNARDKALILWRELAMNGVHAKDRAVPHALCEEHS